MAYDQALVKLNYTRSQLERKIREVRDAIPNDWLQAAGVHQPEDGDGSQVSAKGTTPPESGALNLQRGQMSGRRPRPAVRKRFISTICEFCKEREREIGMDEDSPQVGSCAHGIEDEVVFDDVEDEFFQDGVGSLSFVEDDEAGFQSDFQTSSRRMPTVPWLKEQLVQINNLLNKLQEHQAKALSMGIWIDGDAERETRAEAQQDLEHWIAEVRDIEQLVTKVLNLMFPGHFPPATSIAERHSLHDASPTHSSAPPPIVAPATNEQASSTTAPQGSSIPVSLNPSLPQNLLQSPHSAAHFISAAVTMPSLLQPTTGMVPHSSQFVPLSSQFNPHASQFFPYSFQPYNHFHSAAPTNTYPPFPQPSNTPAFSQAQLHQYIQSCIQQALMSVPHMQPVSVPIPAIIPPASVDTPLHHSTPTLTPPTSFSAESGGRGPALAVPITNVAASTPEVPVSTTSTRDVGQRGSGYNTSSPPNVSLPQQGDHRANQPVQQPDGQDSEQQLLAYKRQRASNKKTRVQQEIASDVSSVQAAVNAVGAGHLSHLQFQHLSATCDKVLTTITDKFGPAVDALVELDPGKWQQIEDDAKTLEDDWGWEVAQLKVQLVQLRQRTEETEREGIVALNRLSGGGSVEGSRGSGGSSGQSRSFLKKIDPPTFSGKATEYIDFKINWQQLVASQYPEDSLQILTIKKFIPKADQERIVGIQTMSEVWKRLDRVYGDLDTNKVTIKGQLQGVVLKGTAAHEKIQSLFVAVQTAVTRLEQLGVSREVLNDLTLIASLISKLTPLHQEQYDEMETSNCDNSLSRFDRFWEWLKKLQRRAESTHLRDVAKQQAVGGGGSEIAKEQCRLCKAKGHFAKYCPIKHLYESDGKVRANAAEKITTRAQLNRVLPDIKKSAGDCPMCKTQHTYDRKFPFGPAKFPASRLENCPKWKALSTKEKAEKVQEVGGCKACTSWSHAFDNCWQPQRFKCKVKVNGSDCGAAHNTALHNSGVAYCNKVAMRAAMTQLSEDKPGLEQNVLLEIQAVEVCGHNATVLFDNGSSATLVTHTFAQRVGLKGKKITYYLRVVGQGYSKKSTLMYKLKILDNVGKSHILFALGIDTISEEIANVSLEGVKHLFPFAPKEAFERPGGEVDLLVGQNYRQLQPWADKTRTVGRLRMCDSLFGCGMVLTGYHEEIRIKERSLTNDARVHKAYVSLKPPLMEEIGDKTYCHDIFEVDYYARPSKHRVLANKKWDEVLQRVKPVKPVHTDQPTCVNCKARSNLSYQSRLPSFWEAEELGTAPEKHCLRCRSCRECSYRGQETSREEQEVVRQQEDRMAIDEERNCVNVSYVWKKDVYQLKDNFSQIIPIQTNIEKRLLKSGHMEKYNSEIQKAIDAGTIVKLSDEDINKYKGPVSYCSHFAVFNEGSSSTPLRVVFNGAQKNKHCGLSPNDCMFKGPNALNNLLEVLISWRSKEVALVLDLSKAYQSLRTGEIERNVRRIIWRWGDTTSDWQIFAYDRVTFGDLLASLVLELAKKMAAGLGMRIDPAASEEILRNTYVDDTAGGGSEEEVQRFMGKELEDGSYTGTIPQIFALVGLKPKIMVRSGDQDPGKIEKMGKVLGHVWDPKEDKLSVQVSVNLSKKARSGERMEPDLGVEDVPRLMDMVLTRRKLLSFTMAQYDPLGLICPLTIKYKIALKDLVSSGADWDQPLEGEQRDRWRKLLSEAISLPTIEMGRSVRPKGAVGSPWVVGFSDGSLSAFGCAIYVRYHVENNGTTSFETRLMCGKARVTPIQGTTSPRSELQALLVLLRLTESVVRAMSDPPARVVLASDSECCIAALDKLGGVLKPYFANRVGEAHTIMQRIRQISDLEPVQHIQGADNIADLPTRGAATVKDVLPGSVWQDGPSFLKLEREQWPLSREFKSELPAKEVTLPAVQLALLRTVFPNNKLKDVVESVMDRTNVLDKAIGVVARLLRAHFSHDRAAICVNPSNQDREAALALMFRVSMQPSIESLKAGKLINLGAEVRGGLVVMTGRCSRSLQVLVGKDALPVLMPSTRLACLLLLQAHKQGHKQDPRDALARVRAQAWIVRGRQLAISVVKSCPACRLRSTKLAEQIMAQVPSFALHPCPPFTHTALDFLGPYKVKGMGNSRVSHKAWGLLYVCLNTKAVKILAVPGYSTDDFLVAHKKFVSNWGAPALIVSDQGSQLRGARRLLVDGDLGSLDWRRVEYLTSRSGTSWKIIDPGCQWQNGTAEAMIKIAKSTMSHVLDSSITSLNFAELDAVFAQVADIMNCRPLGVRSLTETDIVPICPNNLLLGRANNKAAEKIQPGETLTQRLEAIEELTGRWWHLWYQQVFPSLVPYPKWATSKRDVQVGDVVLILYEHKMDKGEFKLGRVLEVHPGDDGVVRRVTVGYSRPSKKLMEAKPLVRLTLGVQRLVVVMPKEEQQEGVSNVVPEVGEPEEVREQEEAKVGQQHDVLARRDRKARQRYRKDWAMF